MARTRQTPRKKKDSSPKKKKKAQSGPGQPSAETMDTSQTSQACEKPKVTQDSPTSAQEQQKVDDEGSGHQESESGSDLQKDTVQTKSPVSPPEKSPPETAGRKRKKEDDHDISTVDQGQTETATSPKKTKLSEDSKDSEHADSDQQSKEEVKGDIKQVESASDRSGGGTCEAEKDGGDDDEAPEDLSLAEGKQIALEQKRDESVQAQRILQEAKERRRKKDEQFKMQKDARRSRELEKFSEEGLKEVARRAAEGKASQKNQKKAKTEQKKSNPENTASMESKTGSVTVVALDTPQQAVAPSYEEARNFLHQQLHGDRHKRIPALSFQAQKYIEKPAKNFTT